MPILSTKMIGLLLATAIVFPNGAEAIEFHFTDPSYCQTSVKSRFCHIYKNKISKWTPEQKRIVTESAPNEAIKGFAKFDAKLKAAGIQTVYLAVVNSGPAHAETYYSHDDQRAYVILRTPYFNTNVVSKNNVSEKTHVLLHELVHVFVRLSIGESYSSSPFWVSLTQTLGWTDPSRSHPLVDQKLKSNVGKLRNSLVDEGRIDEANTVEANFARSRGFPSLYSTTELREFFAELISFLVEDPTLAEDLSSDLREWLRTHDFADFLPHIQPEPILDYIGTPFLKDSLEHVGLLYVMGKPRCSISILRHGLLVTAKHCFTDVREPLAQGGASTFLKVEFPYAKTRVLIDGLSIQKISFDSGENDFAFIQYNSKLTQNKVNLPAIKVYPLNTVGADQLLLMASYREPDRVRRLKLEVQLCYMERKLDRIETILPQYSGLLQNSSCMGYFGSSGAPIYTLNESGELSLAGVVSHTFEIDSKGKVLSGAITQDSWGSKTKVNFSRVMDLKDFPLVTSSNTEEEVDRDLSLARLTPNQIIFAQTVEQKLRQYHASLGTNTNSSAQNELKIQLRVKINLANRFGVNKDQLNLSLAYLLSGASGSMRLLEDELTFSVEKLTADQITELLKIVGSLEQ